MNEMPVLHIDIEHEWEPVELSPGKVYVYPKEASETIRERWSKPALYRWNIYEASPGDLRTYSYGETANLSNRIYQYRNPTREQATQSKVKVRLTDAITSGKVARLEWLKVQGFKIGDLSLSSNDLSDPSVRKLIEQILIFNASRTNDVVWNTLKEPDARELLKW
jgi:hypothetical protein